MYLFAHLGIGSAILTRLPPKVRERLPVSAVLIGTMLPDLIDKPLYYGLVWATGVAGAGQPVIAGTRGFGHTLLFLVLLFAFSNGRPVVLALAWGVYTHLLIDNLADVLSSVNDQTGWFKSLLWPLKGWQFPVVPYRDFHEQLAHWTFPVPLFAEVLGIVLLFVIYRQNRTKPFFHR